MYELCQKVGQRHAIVWKIIASSVLLGTFTILLGKLILKFFPSLTFIFYPIFLLHVVLGLQMPYVYLHKVPSVFPEESTQM